jgi:hypothetical protein
VRRGDCQACGKISFKSKAAQAKKRLDVRLAAAGLGPGEVALLVSAPAVQPVGQKRKRPRDDEDVAAHGLKALLAAAQDVDHDAGRDEREALNPEPGVLELHVERTSGGA